MINTDVYTVVVYERCDNEDCDSSHARVTAVYATKQTADQHVARHGGQVETERVLTKVREW